MIGGSVSIGMLRKTSCRVFASFISDKSKSSDNLYRCLEHVVNLANVAMMGHITRIAAVENQSTIWEYDPDLPGNHVLGGSLDVISAIWTIAIKIQASGQCLEYFEKLQIQCKISNLLKIPLHSNIRWGSAHSMLERASHLSPSIYFLPQPMSFSVQSLQFGQMVAS